MGLEASVARLSLVCKVASAVITCLTSCIPTTLHASSQQAFTSLALDHARERLWRGQRPDIPSYMGLSAPPPGAFQGKPGLTCEVVLALGRLQLGRGAWQQG